MDASPETGPPGAGRDRRAPAGRRWPRCAGCSACCARDDGEAGPWSRSPASDQLEELLEQTRAAGLPVAFTVEGVPRGAAAGVALAAYRIVQESLTNARKHGGPAASAQVLLRYCEDWTGAADHRRRPAARRRDADGQGTG